MATTDEVLEKLVDVLSRITRPPEKESFFKYLLKHPIVVTAVGSLLVAYGTNWVTKQFQLRDKQADSIATLESEMPTELSLTYRLAQIASVLKDERCEANNKDKKLKYPLIIGLTGKTCGEAEADFNEYYKTYIQQPPSPSLARMRAIFTSVAVDEGARKLSILVAVLGSTTEFACVANVYAQAQNAYVKLLDVALQEIDGSPVTDVPPEFTLSTSLSHCTTTPVCDIPAVAADPDMKERCSPKK